MNDRTALLIGAGFSYELGMPLVWELTKELSDWLTAEKLRALNRAWGWPHEVIEEFIPHLQNPDLHYEAKIAWLQSRTLDRREPRRRQYHSLVVWMTERVGNILRLRHSKNPAYIRQGAALYSGLSGMVDAEQPLWVFSLNHDVCVEALCGALRIPLCDGFPDEYVTFPLRGGGLARFARLPMRKVQEGLPFLRSGQRGINLLKLHGSIDTFRFTDDKDWVKYRSQGESVEEILRELSEFEGRLLVDDPRGNVPGEVVCLDHSGEVQFLRRTLLSGGHKFSRDFDQNAPLEVLDIMRAAIAADVTALVLIGYSGGDAHINGVLRGWMDGEVNRRMVVVDPHRESVPDVLNQWPGRVELRRERTTDFLAHAGNAPRSPEEEALRKAREFLRRRKREGKAKEVWAEFLSFIREEVSKASVQFIASFPKGAAPTEEEARQLARAHFGANGVDPESLMRRFVDAHAEEGT